MYTIYHVNLGKLYIGIFGFTLILQDWNYNNFGLLFFDWLLANLKIFVLQLLPG